MRRGVRREQEERLPSPILNLFDDKVGDHIGVVDALLLVGNGLQCIVVGIAVPQVVSYSEGHKIINETRTARYAQKLQASAFYCILACPDCALPCQQFALGEVEGGQRRLKGRFPWLGNLGVA